MKKFALLTSLLLLAIVTTPGCIPEHTDPTANTKSDGEIESLLFKLDGEIEFADVQRLVFKTNCNSCHNPKSKKDNVDLTSYAAVIGNLESKRVVVAFEPESSKAYRLLNVTGKRQMPPADATQLTAAQKKLVYEWIKSGAKERKGDVVNADTPIKEQLAPYFKNPETIDYGVVQNYVFKTSCTKCHSANGEKIDEEAMMYGADLTDYASIFGSHIANGEIKKVVAKGDPSNSSVYTTTAVHQSMPPQNEDYDLLDSYRLKLLRLWILNCAIEDFSKITDDRLKQSDPQGHDGQGKVRLCDGQ